MNPVRKPSLCCTRSSREELAYMPLPSAVDLVDLELQLVDLGAVEEVPVGEMSAVERCSRGVAALEQLGGDGRVRADGVVVQAVEVTVGLGVVAGEDRAEDLQELAGAAVAFVMLQPGLAELPELVFQPAGDDVEGEASVVELTGGRGEVGEDGGLPEARVDVGDDLEFLGGLRQAAVVVDTQ